MDSLSNKTVLITGGCGSIGSRLVNRILSLDPAAVRVFDNNEEALFELQQRFNDDSRLRYLLGNVRDQDRLALAMDGVDVVFHTAALKHVSINEYNPFETVKTNVQGTQNLVRAALEEEVDSFVGISTDKASNPTSVMGATKLLSERLIIAANGYKGDRQTKFGCVRFGNVLGSSGSVVPIFLEQIRSGGPVTITDPNMTRFIMPIDDAVDLVLKGHDRMVGGEIFVLKMPAFQVGQLAQIMIDEYAPEFGHHPDDIQRKRIGSRPGERTHEKLISEDEAHNARELENMYVILPEIEISEYATADYSDAPSVSEEYTSADEEQVRRGRLVTMIDEIREQLKL